MRYMFGRAWCGAAALCAAALLQLCSWSCPRRDWAQHHTPPIPPSLTLSSELHLSSAKTDPSQWENIKWAGARGSLLGNSVSVLGKRKIKAVSFVPL